MDRIAQLQQLLSKSPNDSFLHHALALEYLKQGDAANARKAFLHNLQQAPDYLATYYHIGKLEEQSGNHKDAIRYYEEGMTVAKKQNDQHAYSELFGAHENLIY